MFSSLVLLGIFKAACNKKRQREKLKCCAVIPEHHNWKVLGDFSHHVAVKGRRVCVHHEQKLVHGLMKRGYQPPHYAIQVLKLPLPVCHLSHHGSQRCPLDHKRSIQNCLEKLELLRKHWLTMAAMAADTDPPPGAAVRAPTHLTNCCRDKDTRCLSSWDFTMYLHRYAFTTGSNF